MLLKKLIIAEDDDAIAHLIAAALGDVGYLCMRARDGEEALAMARAQLPDLLVLDVMMPKIDGLEVVRRLKADVLLSRIPVLMLTARSSVEDRVRGLDAGADDYLAKPFDLRELAARVKALVRQSRRERQRNPTTNLPSGDAIDEHVAQLLRTKARFSLCYVDLIGWEAYSDAHGFRRYEQVIEALGRVMIDASRTLGDPPIFVGHVGGDDFLGVCDPARTESFCAAVTSLFESAVPSFCEGPCDPPLSVWVAVVGSDEAPGGEIDDLATRVAAAKRATPR
ncbi:MAG: response regulator [Myxococcota bacterium]